jgi:hypothetical protein
MLEIRVKPFFLNILLIILVGFFSLPFVALYVFFFFAIGGGWAYAGTNGCHFVLNPIGYLMLAAPVLLLGVLSWRLIRGMWPS